jgi:glycolate oxidase FAD binding subunit
MVNGKGEDLTFGGQVMKNVAGYDVSRLLAGSWGTLGVVTEVSLKVLPVAPAEATLMCAGIPQHAALDVLHRWGGQPLPLNASAWVRDTTAEVAADYLFVRLRGAVAAVQSALAKMGADAQAQGAQVQVMDAAEAAQDWRASAEHTLQFFEPPSGELCLWRLSVPQTAPVIDLPYAQYIEWQGAQRWLWAPATAAQALREAAQRVGGQATLFRASVLGGASDKAVGVNPPLDAVQQRIQRALQQEFDPQGVFATDRMGI